MKASVRKLLRVDLTAGLNSSRVFLFITFGVGVIEMVGISRRSDEIRRRFSILELNPQTRVIICQPEYY
jgi:hypothetical protein